MHTSADHSRRSGTAVELTYQFLLWLIPAVEKFPKSQKFLLGDRMQSLALAVLDDLVAATYTKAPMATLDAANLKLEQLRFQCRLAKDLRHLDMRRYEYAAKAIDDIGRRVGGWRKASHG